MNRRIALVGLLVLAACGGGADEPYRPAVIVIGMDGLDPNLLRAEMAKGTMPNFSKLAAEGDFCPLGTSLPPESPVAWANFITGRDPGGHGTFDFIHRRILATGVNPIASVARTEKPENFMWFFGYQVPWSPGGPVNLVKGDFFWQHLDRAGVPTTIVRAPDNFPPKETESRTFTGMGTPDLTGASGVFTLFTEELPPNRDDYRGKADLKKIAVLDGVAKTVLTGPRNDYVRTVEGEKVPNALVPVAIYPDRERRVARVDIGDEIRVLAEGDWSDWVPVSFTMIPNVVSAPGMVRIYVKQVAPTVMVYVSPVNIDPRDPALPVSTPDEASEELAAAIGPYYTQGMAEETNGARLELLDAEEFIQQNALVLEERERMLDHHLDRFAGEGGFLFFYVSTSDLSAHILYQFIDKSHPRYDAEEAKKYGDAISAVYRRMDEFLGKVMDKAPEGARIVVMSDHGFAPVRRKMNLNTWLFENGFLKIKHPKRQGDLKYFQNVDWFETRAYGVGFQGIYLNLWGREKTGYVNPDEAEEVKLQIIRGLESLTDPKTGERVVTKVYRREDVYHGEAVEEAPDLIVGFNRGYENSDDSALGTIARELIVDNMDPWSGSHLMDPSHVPGVLLANTKFTLADPKLTDLTVTVLKEFGVTVDDLTGRPIW
jgi:predicted AlkP superfamily phosphohydrolase/phosphomutase